LIHGGALEIGSADLPSAHLAQITLTDMDTLADTQGKGLANRRLWPKGICWLMTSEAMTSMAN
jgi:hypothetical protein